MVWYKQATYPVLLISERGDGWGYFPGTAIGEFVIDAKHVINFIKNMFSKMVYYILLRIDPFPKAFISFSFCYLVKRSSIMFVLFLLQFHYGKVKVANAKLSQLTNFGISLKDG